MVTKCPRCGDVDYYRDMRFRAGRFPEVLPDGTSVIWELLCEDCHRDVVRQ